MWLFWVLALVPICIGGILVLFNKRVSWIEWLISTGVALLMALIFQYVSVAGMTSDVETWSGYVQSARHFAAWREYYEEAIYRTETYPCGSDSKGRTQYCTRQVFDHWESETRWHRDYWMVYTTIGDWQITREKFAYLVKKFKHHEATPGVRRTGEHASRMIDGDPNDYISNNKTGWIEPVSATHKWENKVKACPSIFSYVKVSTNIAVFPWPQSQDLFVSERVMGEAKKVINTLNWDQMNANIGATKKVNVIIVGFGSQSSEMAQYQEASWIGGKKNDLVICYGGEKGQPASWVKVFGWTEKNIVKQNLQTLLLHNPVDTKLIPYIQEEIKQNYIIKDWSKFDYLTVEPPTWSYWTYFIILLVVQGGLYVWFNMNEIDRTTDGTSRFWDRFNIR
jgi:hypothetical protein